MRKRLKAAVDNLICFTKEVKPHFGLRSKILLVFALVPLLLALYLSLVQSMIIKSITVDGQFGDWSIVLNDTANTMGDGWDPNDLDSEENQRGAEIPPEPETWIQSAWRDFVRAAVTWDNDYVYFYVKRVEYSKNQLTTLFYIDCDGNGTLENTDRIISVDITGGVDPNDFKAGRANYYTPDSTTGSDPLTGDGVTEPGTALTPSSPIYNEPILDGTGRMYARGGGDGNLELEYRVPWFVLGVTTGAAFNFHISSARNITSLPNAVEDNIKGYGTSYAGVSVYPDQWGVAVDNSYKWYTFTVKNTSTNTTDTFNLSTTANTTWTIDMYNVSTSQSITSVRLAPGATTQVAVRITIPDGVPNGTSQTTWLHATSQFDSGITDKAKAVTEIGDMTVSPDRFGTITTNTTIFYQHTVANFFSTTDTINLSAYSSNLWNVVLKNIYGTTISAVTLGANSTTEIIAYITVPSTATLFSQDITIIKGVSTLIPSLYDEAKDVTTVQRRISIAPDNTGNIGPGNTIFYTHNAVVNSWTATDTIILTKTTTNPAWSVLILDSLGLQEVTSVVLGPYGDSTSIVIQVTAPSTAVTNTFMNTTITATSSLDSNYWDRATDLTRVRDMMTYEDAGFTIPEDIFRQGEIVYAQATGISVSQGYLRWIDSDGRFVEETGVMTVVAGRLEDSLETTAGSALGTWTVAALSSGGTTLTSTTFTVTYNAEITYLKATDCLYYNTSTNITSTVWNDTSYTITSSYIDYVIWWDTDQDGKFGYGDIFIDSDGYPVTYSVGTTVTVRSHQTTGINVGPGGTADDPGWSMNNKYFPYVGEYNVLATWRTSGGMFIDDENTTFNSANNTVVRRIALDPDLQGSTGPGGTVSYSHTLVNQGTTDTVTLEGTTSPNGWTTKYFNWAGQEVTTIATYPGETTTLIVQVTAPSYATTQDAGFTTLTARSISNPIVSDQALDKTYIIGLETYLDSTYTTQCDFFAQKDTVYTQGYNLVGQDLAMFKWFDPLGNLIRTSDTTAVSGNKAGDFYTLSSTSPIGVYTIYIYDEYETTFTSTTFTVTFRGEITTLTATSAPNLKSPVWVDSTVWNDSSMTITNSKLTYTIWWDEDEDGFFNAGDTYIDTTGYPHIWDGVTKVYTHETTGVNVGPGGYWSETDPGWSIMNTNFPYRGTYKVYETWHTEEGMFIDDENTTFYSVPTLGVILSILLMGGGAYLVYRRRQELVLTGVIVDV